MRWFVLFLSLAVAGTAPKAAALSCTPGPYIFFFDWESAALDDRAIEILTNSVRNRGACGTTRMVISGHSDTSETPDIADARARAVDRWLMGHGVAPDQIEVEALGASRPLIETGPDIREVQNRRVEILFAPSSRPTLEK
ncbi:OmpA family protein [Sphingomonas sp. CJ99]